jgi:hypothetical protein
VLLLGEELVPFACVSARAVGQWKLDLKAFPTKLAEAA